MSLGEKVTVGLFLFVACDALTAKVAVELARHETERAHRARLEVSTLKQALDTYYASNGEYPQQLTQLVDRGVLKRLTTDPWGHEYVFVVVAGTPVVTSLGKDGTPGGEGNDADISSEEDR